MLAGLSDGFLVALNIQDGQLKWEKKLHEAGKFTDVDAHPVLENGILYIPSYDGALYALKRTNGDVLWKFEAGGSKDVLMEGDILYLPSSDGTVYCVRKDNGKQVWKFDLDRGMPTHLVMTDRWLIFGSSYQYLYAVDRMHGQRRLSLQRRIWQRFCGHSGLRSCGSELYFLSGAGNLYQFAVRPPIRPASSRAD